MSDALEFGLAPERLDEGTPEERAAFGLFTIRVGAASLTEVFDRYINALRPGPLASGYHVAEWLAWNWWRLRWEGRSRSPDWWFAHKMTAIGEGYVWPNVTIFSDGVRTVLLSAPSSRPDATPARYVGAEPRIVPSLLFESAVDAFIPQIQARLRSEGVGETNLDLIWADVLTDRADPVRSSRRKLEALLGRDPDEEEDGTVALLLSEVAAFGQSAVEDLAADQAQEPDRSVALQIGAIRAMAESSGFDASLRDLIEPVRASELSWDARQAAWHFGVAAAQEVRRRVGLGAAPIRDTALAQMAGTRVAALRTGGAPVRIPFALDQGPGRSKIVLRSRYLTGRRFELARLIGARLLLRSEGALHPATRAATYRQKAQRAFAAELLSPFAAVEEMLGGDYSEERQEEVAHHFQVSVLVIRNQLVSHGCLERDYLDDGFDMAA